jgi:hypothetical protein
MTLQVSDDQFAALQSTGGPIHLHDPGTQTGYVLVREDVFQRMAADDFNPRHYYPLVNELMAEDDKSDPWLESYQKLR